MFIYFPPSSYYVGCVLIAILAIQAGCVVRSIRRKQVAGNPSGLQPWLLIAGLVVCAAILVAVLHDLAVAEDYNSPAPPGQRYATTSYLDELGCIALLGLALYFTAWLALRGKRTQAYVGVGFTWGTIMLLTETTAFNGYGVLMGPVFYVEWVILVLGALALIAYVWRSDRERYGDRMYGLGLSQSNSLPDLRGIRLFPPDSGQD